MGFMGLFSELINLGAEILQEIDKDATTHVINKSTQALCDSIATESTTSSYAAKELRSRLHSMNNRQLENAYDEYSGNDKVESLFIEEFERRGLM